MAGNHTDHLIRLFQRRRVVDMPAILRALPGRSRYRVYRDLKALAHLRSYNQAGRFFTLPDIPRFDPDGLWRYRGAFFSRFGTLKATVRHLVRTAVAGCTHRELQELLDVRVYNTLLDLLRHGEIARESFGRLFLYVHLDPEVRARQVARRQEHTQRPTGPHPSAPEGRTPRRTAACC